MPFDVPDELQIKLLNTLGSLGSEVGSLDFLFAVAEDCDAGTSVAEKFARINSAHNGELGEVDRFAIGIGASVDKDEFAFVRGNDRGDCRTLDTIEPAHNKRRGG